MTKLFSTLACAALAAAAASPAPAQMSFGLGSVSAGLALVSPEDIDGTFGITLGAEVGTILENLDARADLIWWSTSEGTTGA